MINMELARGDRVRYTTEDNSGFAIFVCVTPANWVILAAERSGVESSWPADVIKLEVVKITCPDCGVQHNINRESKRCADCERTWAYKQPAPSETCETCGKQGAVYSPLAKAFRCPLCHAKAGTLTGLGPEARALTEGALCRSDDVDSDRHDWRRAKSSYLCKECKIKVSGKKPAGYAGA